MNCANCGEELFEGDAFCTECGSTVADSAAPSTATASAYDDRTVPRAPRSSEEVAVAAASSHSDEELGLPTCTACGEPLEPGAPFCTQCGQRRGDQSSGLIDASAVPMAGDDDSADEPAIADTGREERSCAECGEEVEQGAVFCTGCGARQDADTPLAETAATAGVVDGMEPTTEAGDLDPGETTQTTEPGSPDGDPAVSADEARRCQSCGESLEAGSVFCVGCGSPVAAGVVDSPPQTGPSDETIVALPDEPALLAEPAADSSQCATCGEPLLDGAEFCTSCGASAIGPETTAEPVEATQATPVGATYCIMCGHSLPAEVQFCTNCGADQAEPDQQPERTQPTPALTCLACGEAILPGSTFCTSCGSILADHPSAASAAAAAAQEDPAPAEPVVGPGLAAFCIGCGNRLEANDEFCIKCGHPRDAALAEAASTVATATQEMPPAAPSGEPPDEAEREKRSLLPLWIVLGVIGVAAVAWFGWQFLSGDGDEAVAESSPGQEVAADDGGASDTQAAPADTTATDSGSGADAAACEAAADDARVATVDLALAFSGMDLDQLVGLARIGRQSVPGAGAFDTANAPLLQMAESADCSMDDRESLYSAAMATVPDPVDPAAGLVHAASAGGYGFDGNDLLTRVAAALRMYPIHGGVVAVPAPSDDLPRWTVILESLEVGEFTESQALTRAAGYTDRNIPADVLNSSDYGSLNPGYWAIYTGMFEDRADASALCSAIRSSVDYCYDRYLQQLPTTTGPNGACGPYGRFDVTGVASGSNLDVRVGPSSGQNVVGTYSRSATGILAAGPEITVGSSRWTPLEVNGKIGWAESRYLSVDPACAGTVPPPPQTTSCPAVAVATTDLLQSIVSAAEAADVSGISAVTGIDMSTFDNMAEQLVADASGNGCDVAELNDLVVAQNGRIAATGSFAQLVRDTLLSQPFYSTG